MKNNNNQWNVPRDNSHLKELSSLGISAGENRHPVDELADVRDRIRTLKEREEALREMILSEECSMAGDRHVARVTQVKQDKVDTAAMKAELGLQALRPFLRSSTVTMVKITERK